MCDPVILAKVAEQAERFDDMKEFMKERVETGQPLSTEERDIFSAAFKNAMSGRRQNVRYIREVANQHAGQEAALAQGYCTRIESELQGICDEVLRLLREILLLAAPPGETKTFYLKMEGDYCRYLAEFAAKGGQVHSDAMNGAIAAYQKGIEESHQLSAKHPVRLGIYLNYSVFMHEAYGDKAEATRAAYEARDLCVAEGLSQEDHDAIDTMQLIQSNLDNWSQE
eukprot:TRINITY_DN51423_c0_g1_i1.p1 TRINITY_DN51423_c0_g1~~TRINITY_DN51423_c0_g1_i1.p1  ORF type:complete len:226 (-),score=40.09 TRINITY_DN51423_c0_g1_i1:207-884(-)